MEKWLLLRWCLTHVFHLLSHGFTVNDDAVDTVQSVIRNLFGVSFRATSFTDYLEQKAQLVQNM